MTTNKPLGLHSTLITLVNEHGMQEVLRVLVSILRSSGNEGGADHLGRARQAIHVKAPS